MCTYKTVKESGVDCLVYAIFARRRLVGGLSEDAVPACGPWLAGVRACRVLPLVGELPEDVEGLRFRI